MAENKYKKEEKVSKKKKKLNFNLNLNRFSDPRFKLTVGLFLMVFAVCMFIAFVSYIFTGTADQSIWDEIADSSIRQTGKGVHNWLGVFGATLAHLFIYRWFGISAFLLVPFLFLYGYSIVFKKEVNFLKPYNSPAFFFLIWLSVFLGYFAVITQKQFILHTCGGIGYEIADWLNSFLRAGTLLVLFLALAVFFIYYFDIKSFFFSSPSIISDEEKKLSEEDGEAFSENKKENNTLAQQGQITEEDEEIEIVEKEEHTISFVEQSQPSIKKNSIESLSLEVEIAEQVEEKPFINEESETIEDTEDEFEIDEGVEERISTELENYDPTLDLSSYKYPNVELLVDHSGSKVQVSREELEANKDRIVETLGNYKIGISSIKATIGPTVTLYEIVPEAGIKISKIKNLEDDIALSLAALGIRIIAPIPGKGTIGIEVPNKSRELVSVRSVVASEKFMKSDKELPIVFGKTISNEIFVIDLAKMPHILMAGATGQGKSVGINIILASLLYKKHPSQLKFVLIDPKKVELSIFSKIERHFLAKLPGQEEPIITDTKKVIHTLNSLCIEMDTRYDLLKEAGCRNIKEYNGKFIHRKLNPNHGHHFLPYIVVVIDELADLMMTAGKEVETPIARIAQLARAIGIHLVVATQRPSVNVITGVIKANFPARISFKVTSKIDSRTILDTGGADQLVGMGDMLFSQGSDITRIQCAFIDTPEVDSICDYIGDQRGYSTAYMLPEYEDEIGDGGKSDIDLKDRDAMFDEAARTIVLHQQGSTSLLQRKLKLGYNRAGRIIDQLEAAGIVGPFEGSKAREVLVKDEYSLEQLLNSLGN